MIDLTIITSTPAVLRDRLIERDILKLDNGQLVGVRFGTEFTVTGVPNPIVTTLASGIFGQVGYVPAVIDARKVYLVRLAHAADANDDDGVTVGDRLARSKFVQWVIANSVAETINSADGRTYRTRRHTLNTLWFVIPADAGMFGTWQ